MKWNEILPTVSITRRPCSDGLLTVQGAGAGRPQDILIFEVGSLIPTFTGLLLVFFGRSTLGKLWFPLFFMLFMIPLPGVLVDTVTQPMKMGVSWAAEHVLYALGYPIARTGVILVTGPVSAAGIDVCRPALAVYARSAGLVSYLNLVRHDSFARNLTLAILIVPTSAPM